MQPERLEVIASLNDDELYTPAGVANASGWTGKKRTNFRMNLRAFAANHGLVCNPDERIPIKGQGGLHDAWYGRTWKAAAKIEGY